MSKLLTVSSFALLSVGALFLTAQGCASSSEEEAASSNAAITTDSGMDAGPSPAPGSIVISQVYGGGGLAGAKYKNDFVELFNKSTKPVVLDGLTLQVPDQPADPAGEDKFAFSKVLILKGTVPSGGYFLVKLASSGAVGDDLPAADQTGNLDVNAVNGKVALSTTQAQLNCGAFGGTHCGTKDILDLAAYGLSSDSEGSGTAQAISVTTAALRVGKGCQDKNDNVADFTKPPPAPEPRGAAAGTPPAPCPIPMEAGAPDAEAGAPIPPVKDPPLGEEPGFDAGNFPEASPTVASGAADSGCAVSVPSGLASTEATGLGLMFSAVLGLSLVRRRRQRR